MARRGRVLVVDDDGDIRELVALVLERLDVEVEQASHGLQALDLARSNPPDVVTLDLGLPDIDGIETCRRLREFSEAYVVILTAREEKADRDSGAELGADTFMSKPFSPRQLREVVGAALAERGLSTG
ncbi:MULTISPECIES: response regulator [unclassified Nocardioides]|uniref:response regulator transcription factor n=1 Tax=unclassified Nocardioides TaxID=2615069 RepID=UPI0024064918|nr:MULTISPECIES: response regulator [unclassified Nocardioides]MDF9715394.1 response regulator [Nocardioides sp. ChNu-99]